MKTLKLILPLLVFLAVIAFISFSYSGNTRPLLTGTVDHFPRNPILKYGTNIIVTAIKDGSPMPGKKIILSSNRPGDRVIQPNLLTDEKGKAVGMVYATNDGDSVITATNVTDGITIGNTIVAFKAADLEGLNSLERFDKLPYLKNSAQTIQISSHDKTGGNGDAGNYLYQDGSNYVIFDEKGPGVIYRIWYTQCCDISDATGSILLYFDGETSPKINMQFADFLSGNQPPFLSPLVDDRLVSSGGYFSYFPITFKQSLKIVLTAPPRYYQIVYQKLSESSGVTTYTGYEDPATVIDMWNSAGSNPISPDGGNIFLSGSVAVNAGDSASIVDVVGSGAINGIKISVNPNSSAILDGAKIKMYWDGESVPSVDAPIGYFFGSGAGETRVGAFPIGMSTSTHQYYSYFPMPYASSAQIAIDNQSAENITNINYEIQYNPCTTYPGLGTSAGYFKAVYNKQTPTVTGSDYIALNTTGRGKFVGAVLTVKNGGYSDWYEGDERIYVDESQTPQFIGTGTEDFFNGGNGFNEGIFSLPIHGAPASPGYVTYPVWSNLITMYRFFLGDAINFNSSIKVGFEHGPANNTNKDYYSVAFYYQLSSSSLQQTDMIDVGNSASETSHSYAISSQTWSGSLTAKYEGDEDSTNITDDGRAYTGYSQFNANINPVNAGVRICKRFDYYVSKQGADIYVDGQLVGDWYDAGNNGYKRWRDSCFDIPSSFTAGKSSITIKSQYVSGNNNYNEFRYKIYSFLDVDPPIGFNLISPANNSYVKKQTPVFSWESSADFGSGLAKYQLYIDGVLDRDDITPFTSCNNCSITATPSTSLSTGSHTWYVKAVDKAGNVRQSSAIWNFTVKDNFVPIWEELLK